MARNQDSVNAHLESKMRRHGFVAPHMAIDFVDRNGATFITCDWPTVSDPERPNKRLRPLRVAIARSLCDALRLSNDKEFQNILRRTVEIMAESLHGYSPDSGPPGSATVEPFDIRIELVDLL